MAFKKSILISNDIWEKVKSNNNNFPQSRRRRKNHHPLPSKTEVTRRPEAKTSNYTETFYKIRVEWKGKRTQEKSNLMKNGKILAKGIRADEEILNFSDQMRSLLYIDC